MKIADIRDPKLFQRLIHRLFIAERGSDFHVPDDSGGDRGNDGYDPTRGILYAVYCPEKPDTADYRRKAFSDLQKAQTLSQQPGYSISSWVFVTPTPLREPLQAELRARGATHNLAAAFLADAHLEDLFRRHPHLRDEFPQLEYPDVARQLAGIRELVERLQPEGPEPESALAVDDNARSASRLGVLSGMISPRLVEIYLAAEGGDPAALAALERYRMEAQDPRDFLDAVMLSLQVEGDLSHHARALQFAQLGLGRARQASLPAETAVFAANVAFYQSLALTHLETEHESNLQFSRLSGMPFHTVEQIEAAERPILAGRAHIDELFKEARAAALNSNNLVAIHIVMVRQAMMLTQRHWAVALRERFGWDPNARVQLDQIKLRMERAYEAAIRAARAMHDEVRLATAYGNLANDLRSFGDEERARQHALHALELAQKAGYDHQIAKTTSLLEKLG